MSKNEMKTVRPAIAGYRGVRDEVLRRIRQGVWAPGALLPAEAELADEFGMARATVNRAMQELTASGYIERKRKGGTRVRERPIRSARFNIPLVQEEIETAGYRYGYRLVSREIRTADADAAEKLCCKANSSHLFLLCLHLADDEPFQVEERWINLDTLPEAKAVDFTSVSPNAWLVERVPFTDVSLLISAVSPSKVIAGMLGQHDTQPSLQFERVTWLSDKTVTLVRLYFRNGYALATQY